MIETRVAWKMMEKYIPLDLWEDLMYVGSYREVMMFKHVNLRTYVNIDKEGNFYTYTDDGYVKEIRIKALRHVGY